MNVKGQNEALGLLNLRHKPVPRRHLLKSKGAIRLRDIRQDCVLFRKFRFIGEEQANQRTAKRRFLFIDFQSLDGAVKDPVHQRLPIIDLDLYNRDLRSLVFEYHRVLRIIQNIFRPCSCEFFYIIGAKRCVHCKAESSVLGHPDDFQQPVFRNHAAVRRHNVLVGKQSKGDIDIFAVHADAKGFILLNDLFQFNGNLLAFVIERSGGFGQLHELALIDQFHSLRFCKKHPVDTLRFLDSISPQIQRFRLALSGF